MDLAAGMLLDPPNLPGWDNLPIRQLLADRLQKPTTLQNDANAASYGEFWVGAGKDHRSQVMFTLGTGIGCGIVVDGMIIEGRHSPRGRMWSYHHRNGKRAPVFVWRVRSPRGLCVGDGSGQAGA